MRGEAVNQRQAARSQLGKEPPGPFQVVTVRAAGDEEWLGFAEAAQVGRESLVFRGVIFRAERPAAVPVLVADAPVADPERLGRPVGGAAPRQGAVAGIVAVLEPVPHLRRRAAADVTGDVRLGAEEAAEAQELVRPELVRLDRLPPPQVDRPRPLAPGADAVGPVVVIRETP